MDKTFWLNLAENEDILKQSMARPWWALRFAPQIEKHFLSQLRDTQATHFFQNILLALILYDLFAIADWFYLPDVYLLAWFSRFLVVTPILLLTLFFIRKPFMDRWRELLMALMVLVTTVGVLVPLAMSRDPLSLQYHYCVLIIPLYAMLMLSLRFSYVCVVCVLVWVAYSATVMLKLVERDAIFMSLIAFNFTLIGLIANFRQERSLRQSFVMISLFTLGQLREAEAREKLEVMAEHDPLTGLPNRRLFDVEYPRIWKNALRRQAPIALLFVDIDYFKNYNDTYGHAQGDECLRTVANLLGEMVARRPLDLAIRNGGEEFVVLLPETGLVDATEIAERFRAGLEGQQIVHSGSELGVVTASVGVAGGIPSSTVLPENYVEFADKAMYQAKRLGRNQVVTMQAKA